MEQRVSYIFIYYKGHLSNGVVIFNAAGINLQKNFCFNEQKCFYEQCYKV